MKNETTTKATETKTDTKAMTLAEWLKSQRLPNLPAHVLLKSPDSLTPAQRAYLLSVR